MFKKNEKKIIGGLFFLLTLSVFSQIENVQIIESSALKEKKTSFISFLEPDGMGGVLKISQLSGNVYYIKHFDENLNLIKATKLEVEENRIGGVLIKDGIVTLIEYNFNGKEHQVNVLSSTLKSLSFKRKKILTLTLEEMRKSFGVLTKKEFKSFNNKNSYQNLGEVYFSKNKKYIAFNFDVKNQKKHIHKIFIYNKDFEQIKRYDFQQNNVNGFFDYESIEINEIDGSVYLLGKVFEKDYPKNSHKNKKVDYHYSLYKLTEDNQISVDFKTDANIVGESLTTIISNDSLTVLGFYRVKNDWRYKGVCKFDLDAKTLEIGKKNFDEFSKKFIRETYQKKTTKKVKRLQFKSVSRLSNGDIIINAEEFYRKPKLESRLGRTNGTKMPDKYLYGNIFSVKINANAKLVWERSIVKRELEEFHLSLNLNFARNLNKIYSLESLFSFSDVILNDKVFLFLSEYPKTIEKITGKKTGLESKSSPDIFLLSISETGEFDYKLIIDQNKKTHGYYMNKGIVNPNKKEAIFYGRGSNNKAGLFKVSLY